MDKDRLVRDKNLAIRKEALYLAEMMELKYISKCRLTYYYLFTST